VIVTAVPKHICNGITFRKELSIKKKAEVLGIIPRIPFVLLLEHGKTTTSSILGHILYECGVDVTPL
jgi:UDP-N-acetylmuramate--alanine ligase